MNPDKLSRRELRWLALLVEVGVPLERAEELVGVCVLPSPGLLESQLPLHFRATCEGRDFLRRSTRRGIFRRYGWVALWAMLLVLFAGTRWCLEPVWQHFHALNLVIPKPTQGLLGPNWLVLACPFLVLYCFRNRAELKIEEQASDGWRFLSAIASGHSEERALQTLRPQYSEAFREVLVSALLQGRCVRKAAQAWVDCLEWDLMWKSWTRRWRWFFCLLLGSLGTVGVVTLAVMLPLFQLIGCL